MEFFMTADAKIGLLLALVFIVGITFVINGLPDFLNKTNNQPDTAGYINHYKQQAPALVGQSRNIAATLNKPVVTVVTQPAAVEPNSQAQSTEVAFQTVMPAAQEAVNSEPEQTAVKAEEKPQTVKPLAVYEVRSGDSLAEIALKFYGQKEGKKLASIDRIFNANKDKLSSIESIQVGQKLIIPAIESKTEELVKTGMFEKVKPAASKDSKPSAKEAAKKSETPKEAKSPKEQKQPKEQFRIYTIKESDSLWQIAVKQLGDGNRYREIIKLNSDVLKDGNSLAVGTKIKLPAK
jgi:nucleoid-associated protein YgaU